MKVRFLALFLLISGIQAISTSEGKGLIQSNGQAQELLGKLYGSIEESIRLNDKVEETKDGYKEEILNTTRKAQGGGSSGGTGSRGKTGAGGTADVNRRPRQSSAPSEPLFWVSIFNPFVSLALVILFPFHLV
ncbi:hypothetical protein AAZX31_08G217000 [Glycine max]|uniref:Uncharacterized protein n=2 Tax=Glycine subgen. Soja TaxID=1462606 RepID=K7L836_SOYBN|nr:uncharacterized protein LOC100807447 [Glycine max]XP_028246919.1 uncharacterized protein LOC114424282 isoform X1 [Glycine soja]KAH1052487.1 hypothetical protein GYH30_022022 [Glycine max]KAH1238102.1 hypothetical protein GmHk_08G022850 [Glycine max]KHN38058.1 hypothetical protein glysoja_007100 [Glycine soja]KRH44585.1 hypothetical protein GLYMA_08G220300v4 [Glycine max]RZB98191.1 hypothetical protein D0Y65_021273 [Glycine soja]|eukprot:XP_003531750.1 uncharacterized protein LOC100807447 [Glycine max]